MTGLESIVRVVYNCNRYGMSNSLKINLAVSEVILSREGEFVSNDVYNILIAKHQGIEDAKPDLKEFIERKIKALWDANVLTHTGFSYYVNS